MNTGQGFDLNPFEISKFALTSLIVIVLVISLFTTLETRYKNAKPSWAKTIAAIAIIYQYHSISEVSMQFPGKVFRLDCLHSMKGGKRPLGSTSDEFRHPCNANSTEGVGSSEGTMCPSSKLQTNISFAEPFISATRDCQSAQHGVCSISEPCTPCELSRFDEFHKSAHGWSRCQVCAFANFFGACDFVNGVGPYCWKDAVSYKVVPCTKCCTDAIPVFDDAGVCH